MVGPFNTEKRVVESITIAHTAMVPPESLGSSVSDDAVIAPRSGIPLRQVPPVAAAAEAAPADDVPAAEDAELAVADRPEGVETTEVWVDGVKLDHSSPLRTRRSACESLGFVKSGGKKNLLARLWNHLQTREMLAAHAAQHQLLSILNLCQMRLPLKKWIGAASLTILLRHGVNFVLLTVQYKMLIGNKSTPLPLTLVFLSILVLLRDLTVKRHHAVMNLPPTPVEVEDGPHPSRSSAAPPALGVAAPDTGSAGQIVPTPGVHGREPTDEATEASRPVKYPRIMAVFEHEDDTHALRFEDVEVDNLDMYEYDCDEKDDGGASAELAPSDTLKRLCVPYSTFEPELEPAKLLELDLLADELEISAFVCSILHF
eukprot:s821_g30.t1